MRPSIILGAILVSFSVAFAAQPDSTPKLPPGFVLEPLPERAEIAKAETPDRDSTEDSEPSSPTYRLGDLLVFGSPDTFPDPNAYPQLSLSASEGDPNAQYCLAFQQSNQMQDASEMVRWLRAAASQNHAKAQIALGNCYQHGQGVPKDPVEAVSWYRKAAELGESGGQTGLGYAYRHGEGVEKNIAEAMRWYVKAAEQGDSRASYILGEMHYWGQGIPRDRTEAAKWYAKAAEHGHTDAQKKLAQMYKEGDGVPQDSAEAARWYTKLADQGQVDAQFKLAQMYVKGVGVPRDYTEAAKWYAKAAEQGHFAAQLRLAEMYYNGGGVAQDYEEAVKWLHILAEQEYAQAQAFSDWVYPSANAEERKGEFKQIFEKSQAIAQSMLGDMYAKGHGVPQDYTEAAKWYSKAAEQGDMTAQFGLGANYLQGEGVPQDYTKAANWFRKAAEQGEARAQYGLASLYALGLGVLEDDVEAYKWTILAAMNGVKEALEVKDDLRSKMTSGQIQEAQRQARAFLDAREEGPNQDSEMQEEIRATATGFLITPAGHILTACHAVHEADRIEVLHQGKTYPATVIIKDDAADVALLKISGGNFPCLVLASSTTAKTGDEVFTIGYPQVALQGTEPKYTEGTVSSLSGPRNNPKYFQVSVPIQAGNSGGPLLDERGRAVGMVNARLNDLFALSTSGMLPQNVNYAVKSAFILPFLEGLGGLNAQENVNAKIPSERSAVIERTKQAVVMVLCY